MSRYNLERNLKTILSALPELLNDVDDDIVHCAKVIAERVEMIGEIVDEEEYSSRKPERSYEPSERAA